MVAYLVSMENGVEEELWIQCLPFNFEKELGRPRGKNFCEGQKAFLTPSSYQLDLKVVLLYFLVTHKCLL